MVHSRARAQRKSAGRADRVTCGEGFYSDFELAVVTGFFTLQSVVSAFGPSQQACPYSASAGAGQFERQGTADM